MKAKFRSVLCSGHTGTGLSVTPTRISGRYCFSLLAAWMRRTNALWQQADVSHFPLPDFFNELANTEHQYFNACYI